MRLSGTERATLEEAAGRAGLALSAYMAKVCLEAAELRAVPVSTLQRETLLTLMQAAGQVRRAGTNFNQAVRKLNATGQPGPDLEPSAAYCARTVQRVYEAAELIRRRTA